MFVVASDRGTEVVMRSMLVVLVMMACVAVICETAGISNQHRRNANVTMNVTEWIRGLTINKRYVIPTNEQKHGRTVSIEKTL